VQFYSDANIQLDLREEIHKVIHGSEALIGQGRPVILRRLSNTSCPACWDPKTGGSSRPNCPYCKGEGWQFTETLELMAIYRGVAPVYKPGALATGQYPQSGMGYTDTNRGTAYVEVFRDDGSEVFPDYEKYTLETNKANDKVYEVKVDTEGNAIVDSAGNYTRTLKWKLLSLVPVHGDNGRIEFFELGMDKENV
jgi:hypothetical protein